MTYSARVTWRYAHFYYAHYIRMITIVVYWLQYIRKDE